MSKSEPLLTAEEQKIAVNFNDRDENKHTSTLSKRTKLASFEPTVTINTKAALADVFGMYNSPEKSMRFGPAAGSKHAPVRKIEPVAPIGPMLRTISKENPEAPAKTRRAIIYAPLHQRAEFTVQHSDHS